ncbi:MFS general substrate transporter [Aaosphaeria arxii CBS 175.79]|uniref:MFS general substrate transporter n=1 Tax=Aaosphaeria arxii CBS 175.79 TaxID=1450172 RepID=A0A6A5XYZ2_9PLEO|nr:MFS general substrate transporter [Aaosphaeria arxii CBS 175.79]KAF2018113.1 MFS general substrate transporter [Aaosphaeria arxii CBS 175.79]
MVDATNTSSFFTSESGDHPQHLTHTRKLILVLIVCNGILCVTCSSSIYTTTYAQIDEEFKSDTLLSTAGLSSFVFGIGLGPLITGPLSEQHGRRPVYLISWILFIIWTIPSAIGKNITTLIITRFLAGLAGGTYLSVAGGTVSDIYPKDRIKIPMALVSAAAFIGPCLGPVLGGFINYHQNWRWTYCFILIWAALLLIAVLIMVPETHRRVRSSRESTSAGKKVRDTGATVADPDVRSEQRDRLLLLRPLYLLLYEPMCTILSIYTAILLGILYLFFGGIPMIVQELYGFNAWQAGLTFLGIICGMITATVGIMISTYSSCKSPVSRLVSTKNGQPERHLPLAIFGSILNPLGLFWFAWSTRSDIHWMLPITGSAVFGCGTILTFSGIFTYLVEAYHMYAASVLASNGLLRCTFAAIFPLFGAKMYNSLGFTWANTVLAFMTVLLMPFPYIFFIFGQRLRMKSNFARGSEILGCR